MVNPHCAYNELQKQDEMEGSEYPNFPVHVQTKEHKQRNFISPNTTQRKTSIPKVVTGIHTTNPNCVYCIQLIYLAHAGVLVRVGGLSEQKMNAYTYISIPKYFCTNIAAYCA